MGILAATGGKNYAGEADLQFSFRQLWGRDEDVAVIDNFPDMPLPEGQPGSVIPDSKHNT